MENFQELLDQEHLFPGPYTFKFVVPRAKLEELTEYLEEHLTQIKISRHGNYIGVTYTVTILHSQQILDLYEEVGHIDGLIAL